MLSKIPFLAGTIALNIAFLTTPVLADKKYGPGVTDKEILIGQTMPYSGPASPYGSIGKVHMAYFNMINDAGGVNGRKIKLLSLDDAYSPPKAVEQTRRLVEQDNVLLMFQVMGTPSNTAIHKYVNAKKVPHLFAASGATKWGDPKNYPWTIGFNPSYQIEAKAYAKYILQNKPNAKIAILYQNDDYGKDYLKGIKDGLGAKADKMIVSEQSYEVAAPTIDSQVVSLKASGADTFVNVATPKFAAQAIRKAFDIDWKPVHFLNSVSSSVAAVLTPAGLDKSGDIISSVYFKDPSDPQWKDDPAMIEWFAFMRKYYFDGNPQDLFNVYGYLSAQLMVEVLKQCGQDLTRENVMHQAANLKNVSFPMFLPGIKVNTSPIDFFPIEQLRLTKFDGKKWVLFGDVIGN